MSVTRRHRRTIKPLGGVIDVYKCLSCGDTIAVNADSQTFSQPPPLECKTCPGQPDRQAGRYHAVGTASNRYRCAPTGGPGGGKRDITPAPPPPDRAEKTPERKLPMHPKPDTQDPLRAALMDLLDWAENIEGFGRLRRTEALAQARGALADAEVEWEWRAVQGYYCHFARSLESTAWADAARFIDERPDAKDRIHVERRRKAGEWQRVDEHDHLDLLADALSTPGQQEER